MLVDYLNRNVTFYARKLRSLMTLPKNRMFIVTKDYFDHRTIVACISSCSCCWSFFFTPHSSAILSSTYVDSHHIVIFITLFSVFSVGKLKFMPFSTVYLNLSIIFVPICIYVVIVRFFFTASVFSLCLHPNYSLNVCFPVFICLLSLLRCFFYFCSFFYRIQISFLAWDLFHYKSDWVLGNDCMISNARIKSMSF